VIGTRLRPVQLWLARRTDDDSDSSVREDTQAQQYTIVKAGMCARQARPGQAKPPPLSRSVVCGVEPPLSLSLSLSCSPERRGPTGRSKAASGGQGGGESDGASGETHSARLPSFPETGYAVGRLGFPPSLCFAGNGNLTSRQLAASLTSPLTSQLHP
jgi:hypothetical protein